MKQVLVKNGEVAVLQVPAPRAGDKSILVRVRHSCISVGTEVAGLKGSAIPFHKRLSNKPGVARKAFDFLLDQGIRRTWALARGELASFEPTGYSAAGEVLEVGAEVVGFKPGDWVACAGVGVANHAEVIEVPLNLACHIPTGLPTPLASTVALGAIALQGVRRCNPSLGETIAVWGLGILGQLTVQLLLANGCRVIGVDLDPERVRVAGASGLTHGIDPNLENSVARIHALTNGLGADAVIITAATASHQVVSDAMNACRKKGRVVLVGSVGLNLNRRDFYAKELDFLVSCSYGPGRYDPSYEVGGADYPLAFVRWTENRNMQAYLDLLAGGRIRLDSLPTQTYDIDQAEDAFRVLASPGEKPLLVFLAYPGTSEVLNRKTAVRISASKPGRIRVAVIGAGGFAQGMHLPNLLKLRDHFQLRSVVSRTGSNAVNVARQFEAAYATTDIQEVLLDGEVDLVIICTRHHLHGPMVLQALRAGKNVLVEKPLCLTPDELREINEFFSTGRPAPVLMTGFNRRFSPSIRLARQWLEGRTSPIIVNYRMNAGLLPPDHWVHGPEGGGRNIGEACHIYDLFNCLTGAEVESVHARSIRPASKAWSARDNFVATIAYCDGSVCTLTYTALGARDYPKERMEIFADGKVVSLDDYQSLKITGAKHRGWSSAKPEKGQLEELRTLAACLQGGAEWPIPLEQQASAMKICFKVEEQI